MNRVVVSNIEQEKVVNTYRGMYIYTCIYRLHIVYTHLCLVAVKTNTYIQ